MSYTKPGVRARREDVVGAINTELAELSGALVGPLYQVVDRAQTSSDYSALDSGVQTFEWPALKPGAIVELGGTRNGYIDSQRKEFAVMPPSFMLVDKARGLHYPVPDASVEQLSGSEFGLTSTAKAGLERATLSIWAIRLYDTTRFYRPPIVGTQGFSQLSLGDQFVFNADDFTVASFSDVWLTPDVAPSAASPSTFVETDGTQQVNVALGASPGRVVVSVGTSNFAALEPAFAVGDPALVYAPKPGFMSVTAVVSGNAVILNTLGLTQSFAINDVVGRTFKLVNLTVPNTVWGRVVNFDPVALTMELDVSAGAPTNNVEITLYDDVVGYAESFNNTTTQVTLVVPRTFSTTGTAIDLYHTASATTFWPEFGVKASYRALRADLANVAVQVASRADLLSYMDASSVSPFDELGYMAQLALQAQGSQRNIWLVPVSFEPSGDETGLPSAYDYTQGYEQALGALEGVETYSVVCMDVDRSDVEAAYRAHINAMNTDDAQRERFGWLIKRVPLGDVESQFGVIEPGRTLTGTATSVTQGNKWITDATVDFVTQAGVVAGTRVVVTSPTRFAGSYVAHADTTDGVLVLSGGDWEFERYGERTSAGLTIATSAGQHTLSGASAGHWRDVEPGDYLHVSINAVIYRLRVVNVTSNASSLVCIDEAPGDLNFTGGVLAGNVFVIRSYGADGNQPYVTYHIRPLTKQQQINSLIASKSVDDPNYALLLDYAPRLKSEGGAPAVTLPPVATLAIMSGLRSGVDSNQDITQLTMGPQIDQVKWAYNHFTEPQLNALAQAGFWLIAQDVQGQEPYVRDSLTSSTGAPSQREEVVRANSAWQVKTIRQRFKKPVGQALPNNTAALRGLRALQLRVILKEFVDDGRLLDYRNEFVELDGQDPTRNNIGYDGVFPAAEKRIEAKIGVTTQSEGGV